MPAAEVEIDEALVRGLLEDQHPDLANLPLSLVGSGWDNSMWRLGEDLSVRLPRRALAVPLTEHEQRWLPELAPQLPLRVPVPRRIGSPGRGYPWPWSVCDWIDGHPISDVPPADLGQAAEDLGGFVTTLHVPAPEEAPPNPVRGGPLAGRDEAVRDRLARLAHMIDRPAIEARWDALSTRPIWPGPPVWLHGDLHPANLLVHDQRLHAVIDFGDITAGDPATDLSVAWMLFDDTTRSRFRSAAGAPDDDTWARAGAWALALGLAYLAFGADNPTMSRIGHHTLDAVLTDPTLDV